MTSRSRASQLLLPVFLFLVSFAFATLLLIRHAGAADVLMPAASQDLGKWIAEALQLGKSWRQIGTIGALVVLVNLLTNATKTKVLDGLFHKLPDGAQLILVLALSTLSAGLVAAYNGGGWADFIGTSLQSASGAMLLNEVLKRMFGFGAPSSDVLKTLLTDAKPDAKT